MPDPYPEVDDQNTPPAPDDPADEVADVVEEDG